MSWEKLEQAKKTWEEKLAHYEYELSITASPTERFELRKRIEECQEEIKRINEKIKIIKTELNIWQKIWDLATSTEIEPSQDSPAMYPSVIKEDRLDMVQPYTKVKKDSYICFDIDLKTEGHLILLEKGTSGKIWCLCPSRLAPYTELKSGGMILPQPGNKAKKMKNGKWVERKSIKVSGKGLESILAIVTPEKLDFEWLEEAKEPKSAPALDIGEKHLRTLLEYIKSNHNCQVFSMMYEVV